MPKFLLKIVHQKLLKRKMINPKISVIVPAYNEASTIENTLNNLLLQKEDIHELIVIDGGSSDETIALASRYADVYSSPKGRANQMNFGVTKSTGNVLLFVHADTLLPLEGLSLIKQHIVKGGKSGRFRMRFDSDQWSLKLFATYTKLSCFSYGDQCFFVTRDVFEQLDGYRNDVPFEDVDFYTRLRRIDKPIILREKVTTSARRFLKTGSMKQKWINLLLVGMIYFRFDITKIKEKIYPDIR